MRELMVDFITSLDGYASGEGWPGWWGLEGPEYLAWLGEQPEVTYLIGSNTYRLMSGFAAGEIPAGEEGFTADEEASVGELTRASKVVFSASLEAPLTWANSTLVRDDAVEAVRSMKASGSGLLSTIGSISLCRSLVRAGLVDRFRVVMFPVITGATGAERIYDGYPDVALDMIDSRTFDSRTTCSCLPCSSDTLKSCVPACPGITRSDDGGGVGSGSPSISSTSTIRPRSLPWVVDSVTSTVPKTSMFS